MAFLLGLVAGRKLHSPTGFVLLPLVFMAVIALRRRSVWAITVVVLCGFAVGLWRGSAYFHQLRPYQTLALQKVQFTATANIDAVYGTNGQMTFVVRNICFTDPSSGCVPGMVKVSGFGATMLYRGDQLVVNGKLYPTRGANQASVSYAEIAKLGSGGSAIDTLRRKFAAGIQSALPEPLASFAMGLLVGQRNTLPADLSQALLMVGLTHIIAVSGYNLTILLQAARRLLGDHSKVLTTAAALLLIAGFLALAGTSASIVRAAVVSVLGLSAWYYGRTVRPVLLILLAATGTAYANPVYIWADLSWYLSFLAFFGIVVLGPQVTQKLFGEKEPSLPLQILVESLCAEVMTLPLVLYIFGQMSLVSLIANVLVAALIPLAMLLSLVAGLAGMLLSAIAGWFAWPAVWLLTYMLAVVRMLAGLPHIFVQNRYLSVIDMALCYGGLLLTLVLIYLRQRRKSQFISLAVKETG